MSQVPSDCDLRSFPFLPLDVVRLRDSRLALRSTGDEFKAAVLLWCAAWHQVPAGSLPDDEIELAALAGCGPGKAGAKAWAKVRDMALHGWAKGNDGRLHHAVIGEKVAEAWRQKQAQRAKAEKRWGPRQDPDAGNATAHAAASPRQCHVPEPGNATEREREQNREGVVESATTTPPDPIEVDPQPDPGQPSDQLVIQELAIAGAQGLVADHARWLGSVRASGLPAVLAGIAAVLKAGGTPWHREVAPVVARAQAQAADRKRHQAQAKPATPDLEAVKRRRAANAEELDQARRIDRWLADHPDAADRAEDPARVRTWIEYLRTAIERTTASLERPIGLPLHEVPRMLPELRAWLESTAPAPAVAP